MEQHDSNLCKNNRDKKLPNTCLLCTGKLNKTENTATKLFQSASVRQNPYLTAVIVHSNLVWSIVLCNARGPYIGVPWTKELSRCWIFESTSSNNSDAPSGVDTDKTNIKHLIGVNIMNFAQWLLNVAVNIIKTDHVCCLPLTLLEVSRHICRPKLKGIPTYICRLRLKGILTYMSSYPIRVQRHVSFGLFIPEIHFFGQGLKFFSPLKELSIDR